MLEPTMPTGPVGVIVGRFQVHELHAGHRALIETVCARHQKVGVLLGSTPGVLVTRNNPLDYQTRRLMIQAEYPNVVVHPIKDQPTDGGWSESVDHAIRDMFEIGPAVLYGSRDGFAPSYSGRYKVVELQETMHVSGTDIRNSVRDAIRVSPDFRHGVVYAAFNRHPVAYPTVDIAITRLDRREVALGRKRLDPPGRWRFPGGFVDAQRDDGLEAAARRELREEFGSMEVGPMAFVGSRIVDDWRYKREVDAIVTSLFHADYTFGPLIAGDDIDEAEWFDIDGFVDRLVSEHVALGGMLLAYLDKERDR